MPAAIATIQTRPFPETAIMDVSEVRNDVWTMARDLAADVGPWISDVKANRPMDEERLRLVNLLAVASQIRDHFPSDVREAAREFREHSTKVARQYGALVLSGLEPPKELLEDIPLTRRFPDYDEKARTLGLGALGISSLFGDPFAYTTSRNTGTSPSYQILRSVMPVEDEKHSPLSGKQELGLHADSGVTQLRPDVLTLFGVVGNPKATTFVLPAEALLERLEEKGVREILSRCRYRLCDRMVPETRNRPIPLAVEVDGKPGFTWNWGVTEPQAFFKDDNEATEALTVVKKIFSDPPALTALGIETGQVVGIDGLSLHGRSEYIGFRWLLRTYNGGARHAKHGAPVVDPSLPAISDEEQAKLKQNRASIWVSQSFTPAQFVLPRDVLQDIDDASRRGYDVDPSMLQS